MTNLSNITFQQLKIFESIVKNGNLSKASEEIGLTAPAVTTALKTLEMQIGAATIRRGSQGKIEILPIGHEIAKLALQIRTAIEQTQSSIQSLKEGFEGYVNLGIVSTAQYFAPAMIKSIREEFPKLSIDLLIGNRSEILTALTSHRINLAIMGRPPRQPQVHFEPIGSHPHILIAPMDFHWNGEISDLAQYDFLLREEGSGTRILFERYIGENPALPPIRRKFFSSNESIKQSVIAGLGVAMISASTCQYELNAGLLQSLPLPNFPIMREWFLVYNTAYPLDASSRKVFEAIISQKSDFIPQIA